MPILFQFLALGIYQLKNLLVKKQYVLVPMEFTTQWRLYTIKK